MGSFVFIFTSILCINIFAILQQIPLIYLFVTGIIDLLSYFRTVGIHTIKEYYKII